MFSNKHWGIHPDYHKSVTSGMAIEVPRPPARVIIPVRQHIGAPCDPVVTPGDRVRKGQLIAYSSAPMSSPIHASLSGKVSDVSVKPHPVFGECLSITIENDGWDQWDDNLLEERDWQQMSTEEILGHIKKAGLVGMGGAAFPSHVKLAPPKDKKIDTLIINAAECEPYLTVDHRVMLEWTDRVVTGIHILQKLLNVSQICIGIEDNKMDAVAAMSKAFAGTPVKIVAVPTKYPQGAEKMLIKTLVDREVEPGRLPMDVGVVVQNISTTVAICDAVTHGKPLIERVVTVSGGAIKEPKNLLLRIGTTFADAIALCGGFVGTPEKIIMGGPMMGIAQYTTEVPVIKGTSGILALNKRDVSKGLESGCIRCGRCVQNCPMGLNPSMLSILGEHGFCDEAKEEYHLLDCIECGCCSFNCPAKRNVVHYIKYCKKLCAEKAAAAKKG